MLGGKRIAILAEEGFEDTELIEPMRAMADANARVVIVGSGSKKTYKGKRGNAEVTVDTTADKVKAEDFDAIIVPGGYAPDRMRLHQPMIDLISKPGLIAIGVLELLGAIGLFIPRLSKLATYCLAVLMVFAIGFSIYLNGIAAAIPAFVVLLLCLLLLFLKRRLDEMNTKYLE